jgi:hypothetical protein
VYFSISPRLSHAHPSSLARAGIDVLVPYPDTPPTLVLTLSAAAKIMLPTEGLLRDVFPYSPNPTP